MHELSEMHIMMVFRRKRMKKYLVIIVLLVSAILVVPFMAISVINKVVAEVVAIGTLVLIFNAIRSEKDAE